MDLAAHLLAQRRIDHAMAGQRQLAGKSITDHGGLEVHAVIAAHLGAGARQAGFDQISDGLGVQSAFLIK